MAIPTIDSKQVKSLKDNPFLYFALLFILCWYMEHQDHKADMVAKDAIIKDKDGTILSLTKENLSGYKDVIEAFKQFNSLFPPKTRNYEGGNRYNDDDTSHNVRR